MSGPAEVTSRIPLKRLFRSARLRYLIFGLLLLNGILPLLINNWQLLKSNRALLETQEKTGLTRSAESLSRQLGEDLQAARRELSQLGGAIVATPGPADMEERLRQPWLSELLERFRRDNPRFLALRVLATSGSGIRLAPPGLDALAGAALDKSFEDSRRGGTATHTFAVASDANTPGVAIAVPVASGSFAGAPPDLWVEGLLSLPVLESVFDREAQAGVHVFLLDKAGQILWSEGATEPERAAVNASEVVRDFARYPLSMTVEYELAGEAGGVRMVGLVSPVAGPGWGVLVHRPAAAAFRATRQMVWNTVLASALVLAASLGLAALVARGVSRPIQQMARSANEIADGRFGERVPTAGAAGELRDLAKAFNRMSGHVEDYVGRLQKAASSNQELFIGSIRAFAAAIDAKDPYTRGHSERVAEGSRAIARQLGLSAEMQQRTWIGALLHDVGKIGVDDSILHKGGGLSEDEFEEMRAHPAIGAEILTPIVQLRDMIPAVRFHHEAWNGKGYPDGLKGEGIPLIARIVAVADTFDAMTTNRPYQTAHDGEAAARRIQELVGTRFDPKVVTAFLRAFESGDVKMRRTGATPTPVAATRS
jgi:HD-GYP domain-containing protein (c-di-GMP phosphodiesterase class II)